MTGEDRIEQINWYLQQLDSEYLERALWLIDRLFLRAEERSAE